ncbi:phosphatidylserine/phosphatidylglycerophosphate/cardiolipin synthase family protein [Weissella confusa]|uniref:phospholipase D-like domain-containing protein n=1 Tax=Weissella confusa TaxID=1583 RepID=UPI0021BE8EF9|nr:phosphatidylserine/phosphatidylglycerophosphate/cardiolipin synthase family protein [Weissella confusa]MCT8392972.1 phosphatidylserine/phosphatidylglycerophosphate/cardiolipin synthase family protein [Weissella confusa]
MSIRIVTNNQNQEFLDGVLAAKSSIKIVTPFLSKAVIDELLMQKDLNVDITLITKFKSTDFLAGVNDLDALETLVDNGAKIYAVKNLHTKLFLFDAFKAIVGSANLTQNGLNNNSELGVTFQDDSEMISELQTYFDELKGQAKDYEVTLDLIHNERKNLAGAQVGAITGLDTKTNFGAATNVSEVVPVNMPSGKNDGSSLVEKWTNMLFSIDAAEQAAGKEATVKLDANDTEYKYKINLPRGQKYPKKLSEFPADSDFTKIPVHYLPVTSKAKRYNGFTFGNAKSYAEEGHWKGQYGKSLVTRAFYEYMYDKYLKE